MSIVSWAEFKEIVDKTRPNTRQFRNLDSNGNSFPLYRGQSSSDWNLESTLTRSFPKLTCLAEYLRDCNSARRVIGNYLPSSIPFDENPDSRYDSVRVSFPNIEYLAYLRHHGFPSPILDWSASPYVAAFFAFRDVREPTTSVRIYSYRSYKKGHKSCSPNRPHLLSIGPFLSAHERHAVQQCWYTVAMKKIGDDCVLESHNDAMRRTPKFGPGAKL
jgi:hypothetical protein